MTTEDREHFIAALRGANPEAANEVESLCRHSAGAAARIVQMIESVVDGVDPGPVAAPANQAKDLLGRRIGPYQVTRLVGQGGMGSVYEAYRDQDFHLRVALKVPSQPVGRAKWMAQLETERHILAGLRHPNIARLIDGGALEDGQPWLAMDFVEGRTVTTYAREDALSIRDRIILFRKICDAVSHAHENLVVHRDLKPENILVSVNGEPHLLDFGIAKLLPSPGADAAEAFRTISPFVTLAYCSPEQARAEPVTTRSDVYSLGVILFELLTEDSAWEAQQASDGGSALRNAVDKGELAAPGLDADLDSIIRFATRHDPADRYPSAMQLSADLGRFLAGLPVEARARSFGYRASKFIRRRRRPLTFAALVLLSAIVGGIAFVQEAARAERRFQLARKLANVLLTDIFDQVGAMPEAFALRSKVSETATNYLEALSREAGSDPALRVELAAGHARVAAEHGRTNTRAGAISAEDIANRGLMLLQDIPEPLRLRSRHIEADLRLNKGFALRDQSRFVEGIEEIEKAVALSVCEPGDMTHCILPQAYLAISQQAFAIQDWNRFESTIKKTRSSLANLRDRIDRGQQLTWELLLAAMETRVVRRKDNNPALALQTGLRSIPLVREAFELPQEHFLLITASVFLCELAFAVDEEPAVPPKVRHEIFGLFWQVAQRNVARDPGNLRMMSELAIAAELQASGFRRESPLAAARWFEKATEIQGKAQELAGQSLAHEVRLWECGRNAIEWWLRAGRYDEARQAALEVSRRIDPNMAFRPHLPRSPEVWRLQASWFAASVAAQVDLPQAKQLHDQAEREADALLAAGSKDVAALVSAAAVYDMAGGVQSRARADRLWRMVALAVPENAWVRNRLAVSAKR